jgi:hypothetical protein
MKILKKITTERGVFGKRKEVYGILLFQKNGIRLYLPMKTLSVIWR